MRKSPWSNKNKNYLIDNYKSYTNKELAEQLGMTLRQVSNMAFKIGLRGKSHSNTGRFKKGHESWNKGFRGLHLSEKTQFKKGNLPKNTRKDGDLSLKKDKRTGLQYFYIRIAKAKWVLYHRKLYEEHYGKIPAKHAIVFKDGNQLNCSIENLEMISLAENARRNRNPVAMGNSQKTGKREKEKINSAYYVAGRITKDKEIKRLLVQQPELIELKRNQIILQRIIRETKNGRKVS